MELNPFTKTKQQNPFKKSADGTLPEPLLVTEKKPFLETATGIAVSIGVLFVSVWVISKAWRTGQK
jgi:hypothetical protein